jgi:GNAT superfamily N-acetyltransferase
MEWQREDFTISTNKSKLNIPYIHRYLSSESYWAAGVPFSIVEKSIEHSICFGVYDGEKQIGFARVITDEAIFAYLADVFIDAAYRGKGLGKWLMDIITHSPFVSHLRSFMLATKDAHKLYEQFGFTSIKSPELFMSIHRPNIYELMKNKEEENKQA